MATKRKGTLAKIGTKVKKATKAVVKTADEYVVEPVGHALGLTKKKPARRQTGKKTSARKPVAQKSTPRRRTAKKS